MYISISRGRDSIPPWHCYKGHYLAHLGWRCAPDSQPHQLPWHARWGCDSGNYFLCLVFFIAFLFLFILLWEAEPSRRLAFTRWPLCSLLNGASSWLQGIKVLSFVASIDQLAINPQYDQGLYGMNERYHFVYWPSTTTSPITFWHGSITMMILTLLPLLLLFLLPLLK